MATYTFTETLVWDINPGRVVRALANTQVTVANAATGAVLFTVTSNSSGTVTFSTTDIPTVTLTAGSFTRRVTSQDAIESAASYTVSEDAAIAANVNNSSSSTRGAMDALYAPALVGGKAPARKGELVVNVKDYGAKGDGTTNDSTAIASCLADANSTGRSVYFPAGTYVATVQVPVAAQLTGLDIRGDGVGRTIIKASGTTPVVTVGDGGSLDAQHVTITDMTIDGNSTATVNVKMNHTRFLELSDVILQGATTYNLQAVGDLANYFGEFHRVRFRTAPINVYLDGGTAGIGGNSNYFDKCHFSGSSNVNYNGANDAIAIVVNGGDSNIFADCEFVAAGTAIYLHNSAVGNKIRGNQFDGPTTAVNVASAGAQNTIITDNTGTVTIVDNGSATLIRQGTQMGAGSVPLIAGGTYAKPNIVPFTVKSAAAASTDGFRVEKSDGTTLFRVDSGGNIETSPTGAVLAHGHSTWDNAVNSSVVMTLNTGPNAAAIGLRLRGNSGQTGDLISFQDNGGTVLGGIGPKGSVRCAKYTTATRPSASTLGAAAMIYDTTLSKPIWSDGSVWRDATGTAV